MNIGIISDEYYPPWDEGRKNITKCLVDYLTNKGSKVHILSSELIDSYKHRSNNKKINKVTRKVDTIKTFRQIVRDNEINILFSINSARPFFAVKPYLMEKLLGIPYFLYIPSIINRRIGTRISLTLSRLLFVTRE